MSLRVDDAQFNGVEDSLEDFAGSRKKNILNNSIMNTLIPPPQLLPMDRCYTFLFRALGCSNQVFETGSPVYIADNGCKI